MTPYDVTSSTKADSTGRSNGEAEGEEPRLVRYEARGEPIRTADIVGPPAELGRKVFYTWHPPMTVTDPLDIYPGLAETNSTLQSAVGLLDQAIPLMDEASSHDADGDVIAADDAVQRLRGLLPELFCCRALGDGFGAAVNAVHYSLANRRGLPLDASQIRAVGGALRLIRKKPFLSLEEALGAIDSLEDSGLAVGPSQMGALADITNAESLS